MEELLTEKQAQDFLKVSRTTLWRLRRKGGLPHFRVGGEIRYRPEDLQAWLNAHQSRDERKPPMSFDPCSTRTEEKWRHALMSQDWGFHDESTNDATHSLHPYPAKFPPPLPARLIEILSAPGQRVLDPFCGSGTTLVEALRLGRDCIGVDVNPVGVLASRAKTGILDSTDRVELEGLLSALQADADRASGALTLLSAVTPACQPHPPPAIPNIEKWFEPSASDEIGLILSRIALLSSASSSNVARACLSAIIVQVSNQDSETRYVSKPRALAAGEVLKRFGNKLMSALNMHETWAQMRSNRQCDVILSDARQLQPEAVGVVNAVVTSPPYANAFDYHLYHRHRMFWLGYDPRQVRKLEIGSHLNHQQEADGIQSYTADMHDCLHALAECVGPGTPAAFVVGDSVFHGEKVNNARILIEQARRVGFRCIAVAKRPIHPIKRSMIKAARRARTEHVVLLVRKA